jgi:hypothetical protein
VRPNAQVLQTVLCAWAQYNLSPEELSFLLMDAFSGVIRDGGKLQLSEGVERDGTRTRDHAEVLERP